MDVVGERLPWTRTKGSRESRTGGEDAEAPFSSVTMVEGMYHWTNAYLFPNAETSFNRHHNSFDFSRLSNKTKLKSESDKDVPRKRRAAT